jgi:holliday junction DNA helicase RuvA
MIAFLSGKVVAAFPGQIILRVSSGVGYLVQVPPTRTFMVNENVELFTLEVLRENKAELFGFSELKDREWVEKLVKVDGVGPRSAANMIYVLGWEGVAGAIRQNDAKVLASVKGLGSKTAKKILLELKSKEIEVEQLQEQASTRQDGAVATFAETLSNLGYKRGEIVEVISQLKKDEVWDENNLTDMVKQSLKRLAKK